MTSNIAVVAYVPSTAHAFLANLSGYETEYPVFLIGPQEREGINGVPDVERLADKRWFTTATAAFLSCLKSAAALNLDYMIHLLPEARVKGTKWDKALVSDAFRFGKQPLFYGSPVCWNPSVGQFINSKLIELAGQYQKVTGLSMPIYGTPAGQPDMFNLFMSAGVTMFHVPTLLEFFDVRHEDIGVLARGIGPWDTEIGVRAVRKFHDTIFEQINFSTVSYSGENAMIHYEDRKSFLETDLLVAVSPINTEETFVEGVTVEPPAPAAASNGEETTFAHGGDAGDLVYACSALKVIGPGHLYLHPWRVRSPFSPEKVELIKPFLLCQDYIESVTYSEAPPATPWNLNGFRERNWAVRRKSGQIESLAHSHLRLFGLDEAVLERPWLKVDKVQKLGDKSVIVHRSFRYRSSYFNWRPIVDRYRSKMIFVGLPDEHANFCSIFGPIDYHKPVDYLETARIIAGAKLFVGNQSFNYAVAEGLKVQAILECSPNPDCQIPRAPDMPLLQNDLRGRYTLPEL